jgi:hypothetical protein
LNLRPHEAQIEDQKAKKAQQGHLGEGKIASLIKDTKIGKLRKRPKKSLNLKTQKLP